jgi:hypothetical protein
LPETLDETYKRTLRGINEANWESAHRLFQFVAVASRPLRVKELAELLAFDFKAGPIPKFYEYWRPRDPVDAVQSTCSSLLAIVEGYDVYGYPSGKVIQFSHFTVKEFLTSARLAEAGDSISRRYHVSMTPAHTLAAQACLGILLYLDMDIVNSESLEEWPLAEYAAEHWADHARFEDVSRNVEDGMKRLFDPRKPHLSVCVWIHDPDPLPWKRSRRAERPLPPLGTPLHYAAFWGLHSIVDFLVVEWSQNVHSRGFSSFTDNVTPLLLASKRGHVKAARMLIEHGAAVMARNGDGETPLHVASQEGQMEVALILIEHGADAKAQDRNGWTPLHRASSKGQMEVARMLIEHGADATAQNMDWEIQSYELQESPSHYVGPEGPFHGASFQDQIYQPVESSDNASALFRPSVPVNYAQSSSLAVHAGPWSEPVVRCRYPNCYRLAYWDEEMQEFAEYCSQDHMRFVVSLQTLVVLVLNVAFWASRDDLWRGVPPCPACNKCPRRIDGNYCGSSCERWDTQRRQQAQRQRDDPGRLHCVKTEFIFARRTEIRRGL